MRILLRILRNMVYDHVLLPPKRLDLPRGLCHVPPLRGPLSRAIYLVPGTPLPLHTAGFAHAPSTRAVYVEFSEKGAQLLKLLYVLFKAVIHNQTTTGVFVGSLVLLQRNIYTELNNHF